MKINIIRVIIMILLLATFFIIFGFSSQNGEQSGKLSNKIAKFVVENLPIEKNNNTLERAQRVIRKIAHFSIYTIVGFLIMSFISTYPTIVEEKQMISSLLIGIFYATSDEIHQGFVPGRSPQVTDVILDSMGVFLGILLLLLILKIYKKLQIKRENLEKNLT